MPEARLRVLIVDDHIEMAKMLCDGLIDRGYDAVPLASGKQALELLAREPFDALLTDLRMPEVDGLGLLAANRKQAPERPVLVMTAFSAIDTAVESIRQGAYHYLTKPFKLDELAIFLGRALEEARLRRETTALRSTLRERFSLTKIIGKSRPMRAIFDIVERVVDTGAPLLITGETGTGKGLLAHAIHAESKRAGGPFVTVNCAALPEALLESELFGHIRGAFTGATTSKQGLFAEASGGTLFLDEIGEMAPALQAKLLHVIEEGAIRPVGSSKEQRVDVRIIAATHRDLRKAARMGMFREDLFYRLDVISIALPPVRHRREDIPELIDHFLQAARTRHPASPVVRFSPEALKKMLDYPWPGNVRELDHSIQRLVLLGREAEVQSASLPAPVFAGPIAAATFEGDIIPIRELQRRYASWALDQMGGHRGRTAETLDIDGKTLAKWLNEEEQS